MKLLHCIKTLGLRTGWAYWMLSRRIINNPSLMRKWALNCHREAALYPEDSPEYKAFKGWAQTLDKYYEDWQVREFCA